MSNVRRKKLHRTNPGPNFLGYSFSNKGNVFFVFCFDWDSLHTRLNSHHKAWSYKKKKHIKVKEYRKSA